MKRPLFVVAASGFLVGCGIVHSVYHGVTAPVRMVVATPTPRPTDVVHPGHPVAVKHPSPTPAKRLAIERVTPTPKPTVPKKSTAKASPTGAASGATVLEQFPTARPVPEKPGYVYSPSDPTKYVDVSGYAPGSKVKDPYSGKIFVVP